MRKALILIFSLLAINPAVAKTSIDLDELSKVAYCYGALTKWQRLHPRPECTQPDPKTATCQAAAKDARKIDQYIAYLSQRIFTSKATLKANEAAQDKGEVAATDCNKADPEMIEPHCPRIDACLTMDPPR